MASMRGERQRRTTGGLEFARQARLRIVAPSSHRVAIPARHSTYMQKAVARVPALTRA
jgi:hypothetical protein